MHGPPFVLLLQGVGVVSCSTTNARRYMYGYVRGSTLNSTELIELKHTLNLMTFQIYKECPNTLRVLTHFFGLVYHVEKGQLERERDGENKWFGDICTHF